MSDSDLLYIGTYTDSGQSDGIYIVRMNGVSGELQNLGSIDAGANPSFLSIHPNGRFLYAVNELEEYDGNATGSVSVFAIARETGALTRLNTQPSEGRAPCYASVEFSGQALLVANYAGGTVAMLPIANDGALAEASSIARLRSNAHCAVPDPTNRFVLCADLGADRVFVYRLDLRNRTMLHVEGGDAMMRPGAGPRHVAFHPTLPIAYVANELDSTVASLHFDAEIGALSALEILSTLPSEWTGKNYPADIRVAPDGRTLYVSNRGHNSIAVFSVAESTGVLTLEQMMSTEGDWPRNFALDPSARWVLVANQRSNSIIVFERDQNNGRLKLTQHRLEIPNPSCIQFLLAPLH